MSLVGDLRLLRRDEMDLPEHMDRIEQVAEELGLREFGSRDFIRRDLVPDDLNKSDWQWSRSDSGEGAPPDVKVICLYGIHVDVTTLESRRLNLVDIAVAGCRVGRFDLTSFYLPFPRTDGEQDEGYYYSPVGYFSTPYLIKPRYNWRFDIHGSAVDALAPLLGVVLEVRGHTVEAPHF